MSRLLIAIALCITAFKSTIAAGTTHALLVGVSEYPTLSRELQLKGSANDVRLYRDLLVDRGVPQKNIRVLADGVENSAPPTKAAILTALSEIAERVDESDYVFLFLAGHGSQQPVNQHSGDEPDGLDEIFLPRDIGRWRGDIASVQNAITDNELGVAIERIRASARFVWAVFDTCHAGTLTRAIPSEEQNRQVRPEALGIDAAAMQTSQVAARPADAQVSQRGSLSSSLPNSLIDASLGNSAAQKAGGKYVYMYASQSGETTPELDEPRGFFGARRQGLFSYTLHRVLSTYPTASYRQAIERVMQLYLARNRQSPSPLYEGSGLDSMVFGDESRDRVVQWRVERQGDRLQMLGGSIHGLANDSVLAVVAAPTAASSDVLGFVSVKEATATHANLVPIAYANRVAIAVNKVPHGAYVRPVDIKVDFRLRIAMPLAGTFCGAAQASVSQAIEQLRRNREFSARVIWVDATQTADLYLCQRSSRLLFLDSAATVATQSRSELPGIEVANVSAPALIDMLTKYIARVARVTNLSRIAAAGDLSALPLTTLTWQPKCATKKAGCNSNPKRIEPTTRVTLRDGDTMVVDIYNPLLQSVDLTILYIDAAYGISVLYPSRASDVARFEAKGAHRFELAVNASPSGFERLLVLAVPVTPQAPIADFASLAQESMPNIGARGGNSGGLFDLLIEAAFGSSLNGSTRGLPQASANTSNQTATMTSYAWTVLPRE